MDGPSLVRVAVTCERDDLAGHSAAGALAEQLEIPLVIPGRDTASFNLLLVVGRHRLELRETGRGASGPVFVDFIGGALGHRCKRGFHRTDPIALAVGLRRGPVTVIDATAGLARDSFALASMGCSVVAVERSPVLGALVHDGMRRAFAEGSADVRASLERINFVVGDARSVLEAAGKNPPDVVYLDPMYPPKKKNALPKKEMRICRRLVGDDLDAASLFEIAFGVAKRRVVVKRHPHARSLAGKPSIRYVGKQVRFDVYVKTDPASRLACQQESDLLS